MACGAVSAALAATPAPADVAIPWPPANWTRLTDGVPVTSFVGYKDEAFFALTVPLPLPRLDIVLTGLAGTPDLYATAGPFWDPEPGNFEWASSGSSGAGVISLAFNQSFTALGGWCRVARGDTNCSLNVGVYGARDANFSLCVTTSAGSRVLVDGVPAAGDVGAGDVNYYNFSAPASGAPVSAILDLISE